MAYFDSAKNRASWNRELNQLRKERTRREQEGYVPGEEKKEALNPHRRRVTYTQLLEQEYGSRRERQSQLSRAMQQKRQKQKEASMQEVQAGSRERSL